ELGERLVQPKVVPPAHCDNVAEPHMRHLVQQDLGAVTALELGRLVAIERSVTPGDASEVLHCAGELRHEGLIVGELWKRQPEALPEECQSSLSQVWVLGRSPCRRRAER